MKPAAESSRARRARRARAGAAVVLVQLGIFDEALAAPLAEALADEDTLSAAAADALLEMGTEAESAVPRLRELVAESDEMQGRHQQLHERADLLCVRRAAARERAIVGPAPLGRGADRKQGLRTHPVGRRTRPLTRSRRPVPARAGTGGAEGPRSARPGVASRRGRHHDTSSPLPRGASPSAPGRLLPSSGDSP